MPLFSIKKSKRVENSQLSEISEYPVQEEQPVKQLLLLACEGEEIGPIEFHFSS